MRGDSTGLSLVLIKPLTELTSVAWTETSLFLLVSVCFLKQRSKHIKEDLTENV